MLLALCILTRTVGFALLVALMVREGLLAGRSTAASRGPKAASRQIWQQLLAVATAAPALTLPVVLAIAAHAAWSWMGPEVDWGYLGQAVHNYRAVAGSDEHHVLSQLARNVAAAGSAWLISVLHHWHTLTEPRSLVAAGFGILAIGGTLARARRLELDALYVLCYLGVVVVWPYRSEMHRFLYPVLPLLLMHAVDAFAGLCARFTPRMSRSLVCFVLPALVATLYAPSLGFLLNRAAYEEDGEAYAFRHITQFYQIPELAIAKNVSARMGQIIEDVRRIGSTTPVDAKVLWVKPNFMAVLARRRGVLTPRVERADFYQAVLDSGADYALLSEALARGNRDGMRAYPRFAPFTRTLWQRVDPANGRRRSALLAIDRSRLRGLADVEAARPNRPRQGQRLWRRR